MPRMRGLAGFLVSCDIDFLSFLITFTVFMEAAALALAVASLFARGWLGNAALSISYTLGVAGAVAGSAWALTTLWCEAKRRV